MGCHPGATSQAGKIPAPCRCRVPAAGTPANQVSAGAGLSAGRPCAAEPCSAACSHPPGCVCGPAGLPMPPAGLHRLTEAGCPQRAQRAGPGVREGPRQWLCALPTPAQPLLGGRWESGEGAQGGVMRRSTAEFAGSPRSRRIKAPGRAPGAGKADGGRASCISGPSSEGLWEPLCQRETFPFLAEGAWDRHILGHQSWPS